MPQHDLDIANQSAPNFRQDLNNALEALVTLSSGTTEPDDGSAPYANQLWYDSANNILKMRNEAGDDWISLFDLNQSTGTSFPTAVPKVIDEDSFSTNSATRPPSQQSTKAYVDTAVAASGIEEKVIVGSETLNNRDVDVIITDIDGYKGISGAIWAGTTGSTIVSVNLKISFSTDNGATFSSETEFTGETNIERHFFVDLSSGNYRWMGKNDTGSGVATGAGPSVNAIRFRNTIGDTQNNQIGVYARLHDWDIST